MRGARSNGHDHRRTGLNRLFLRKDADAGEAVCLSGLEAVDGALKRLGSLPEVRRIPTVAKSPGPIA